MANADSIRVVYKCFIGATRQFRAWGWITKGVGTDQLKSTPQRQRIPRLLKHAALSRGAMPHT
jgi:hypothetical protein